MSVIESKACCESDAQYMRLQGIMATIEKIAPEDVIALVRKCVAMLGTDLQNGNLVLLNAMEHRDLEKAAAAHFTTEADRPVGV